MIRSIKYKTGAIVVLSSLLLPVFGEFKSIFVYNADKCLFVVQEYTTECFVSHYHSYEVTHQNPPSYHLCNPKNLIDYRPLRL